MIRPSTGRSGRVPSLATFLFLLLSVVARPAFADTVRGRVVDPQDRPIAHAGVLILRGQTIVAEVTTDADGRFAPVTLPPGRYDVSVVAPGLRAKVQTIDVAQDSSLDLTFKLSLAARSESVVVSATQVDSALSRTSDSVTVITAPISMRIRSRRSPTACGSSRASASCSPAAAAR